MPTKARTKRGRVQEKPGRPIGTRLTMATRERIKGGVIIDHLHKITMGQVRAEPHQVTAGLGLLKFQLPTLQATDLTSGGEPLTVERVMFGKRRDDDDEKEKG